jgi:hypothetical protein
MRCSEYAPHSDCARPGCLLVYERLLWRGERRVILLRLSLYIYLLFHYPFFFVELCLSAPYVLHNSHFDCAERQDMRAFLKLRQDERCLGFFFVGRSALPQLPRAYRGAIEEKIEWWE